MDKFDGITPGMTDQRVLTVEEEHTVSPTGTSVLSTPMMIAWMELISADLVRPFLPAGFATELMTYPNRASGGSHQLSGCAVPSVRSQGSKPSSTVFGSRRGELSHIPEKLISTSV